MSFSESAPALFAPLPSTSATSLRPAPGSVAEKDTLLAPHPAPVHAHGQDQPERGVPQGWDAQSARLYFASIGIDVVLHEAPFRPWTHEVEITAPPEFLSWFESLDEFWEWWAGYAAERLSRDAWATGVAEYFKRAPGSEQAAMFEWASDTPEATWTPDPSFGPVPDRVSSVELPPDWRSTLATLARNDGLVFYERGAVFRKLVDAEAKVLGDGIGQATQALQAPVVFRERL